MNPDLLLAYAARVKHLEQLLPHYLSSSGLDQDKNGRVLSLGCGREAMGEFLPLSIFYRKLDLKLEYTGVDKSAAEVREARHGLDYLGSIIEGDIRRIDELVRGKFSLILARHPDADVSREQWRAWETGLIKSRQLLTEHGCLLLTAPYSHGAAVALSLVDRAGYQNIQLEESPFQGEEMRIEGMDEPIALDKYVLVASRSVV